MMSAYIRVIPQEPIRTGQVKTGGGYLDTQHYLPGSVLRGALAEWLKQHGREGQIRAVVSGLRFGNLFPSTDSQTVSLPLPSTAVECKLHSGFLNTERAQGHGIRDTLLAAVTYSELVKQGARFPVPLLLRCLHDQDGKKCYARLERASGYYFKRDEKYYRVSLEETLQTKVALSRHRRAAEEGMLYRVVALSPRLRSDHSAVCFIGRIWYREARHLEDLCQALNQVGVGSLTTRGFGRVRCQQLASPSKPIAERLSGFNSKLEQVWSELADLARQCGGNVSDKPHGIYFSVDLLSSAILVDNYGIPTLRLVLSYAGRDYEPIWWSASAAFGGGFSTAWGLPKPTSLAAAPASTYVYRLDADLESLVPWLTDLENQGVGLRTDEGLGEILICHPFHEEVTPV